MIESQLNLFKKTHKVLGSRKGERSMVDNQRVNRGVFAAVRLHYLCIVIEVHGVNLRAVSECHEIDV
jgi:hypothetical protein